MLRQDFTSTLLSCLIFPFQIVTAKPSEPDSLNLSLTGNKTNLKVPANAGSNNTLEHTDGSPLYNTFNYISNYLDSFTKYVNGNGINYNIDYKGDYLDNAAGGNEKKNTYLNYFYIDLDFDIDKMLGSKGTKLYISSIGTGGENFCNTVGTSQGISNIEAFGTWKIYELWMEQSMLDDRASIKLGLYDLNTEFDARITSSFFINPSHGIGADFSQSGKNGPSIFPTTSMTLRARYKTESNFSIQAAVLDGVPGDPDNPKGTHVILNKNDGLLFTAETGYGQNEESFGAGFEKYVIGGWYYNSRFSSFAAEDYASSGHKGNFGVYASAEKFVYSENDNPAQGISAFLRVGYAESTINRFNSYIGAGAIYKGLFDKRDDDVLGIAIAIAGYSSEFIDTFRSELPNISGPEINLEITYSMQLTGWLNIQPDFQYVANPTYCISNKYAFIAGLRTSVTY